MTKERDDQPTVGGRGGRWLFPTAPRFDRRGPPSPAAEKRAGEAMSSPQVRRESEGEVPPLPYRPEPSKSPRMHLGPPGWCSPPQVA